MNVEPYLSFEGRCEEALNFYRKAMGAQVVSMMRFKESPDPNSCGAGTGDKVMHAVLKIGISTIMASDGQCQGPAKFSGISLALSPSSVAEAERLFVNLAEGGQVQMPLTKTFWSPAFGMLADRFGVTWMISVMQ